jgi:hypothetical protein
MQIRSLYVGLAWVLFTSVQFVLCRVSPTALLKADYLPRRQYVVDCSTAQCGQACIAVYATSDCDVDPFDANLTDITGFTWGTTIIKDTGGVYTPFNSTQEGDVQKILSLSYPLPVDRTLNCPDIQFSFYDASNHTAGFTYISPGQNYTPCVSFDGTAVVSYRGVTMLGPIREGLLE